MVPGEAETRERGCSRSSRTQGPTNQEPTKTPVPRLSEAERAGQGSTSGANLLERIRRMPVRLILREVTQMEFVAMLVSSLMKFVQCGHQLWS